MSSTIALVLVRPTPEGRPEFYLQYGVGSPYLYGGAATAAMLLARYHLSLYLKAEKLITLAGGGPRLTVYGYVLHPLVGYDVHTGEWAQPTLLPPCQGCDNEAVHREHWFEPIQTPLSELPTKKLLDMVAPPQLSSATSPVLRLAAA